jgi:predicted tellurium resistance membrane protein TerC
MFGQTFEVHDFAVIGLLILLEGVLSIDNALVLGLLAKRLPKHQQKKALTYGLVGAFVFRLIAIGTAVWLMKWWFVKLIGGGYLVYIAVKHLFFEKGHEHEDHIEATPEGDVMLIDPRTGGPATRRAEEGAIRQRTSVPLPGETEDDVGEGEPLTAGGGGGAGTMTEKAAAVAAAPGCDPSVPESRRKCAKFWPTVIVIELTDIAFAIDSILAAIALVGNAPAGHQGLHPKFWVVVAGGMFGVILMRFAAVLFIKMLDRFPRFETAAYLLVILIGTKLLVDWFFNKPPENHPQGTVYHGPADFHSPSSAAFWIFWGLMVVCFCIGFIPKKKRGGHGPTAGGGPGGDGGGGTTAAPAAA